MVVVKSTRIPKPRERRYAHTGVKRDHVLIAERALGKPLPPGAQVHHVDGNGHNNANANLVICQDAKYHGLLHVRTRVLAAGGDPNTERICADCKRVRKMSEMVTSRGVLQNQCRQCVSDRGKIAYAAKRRPSGQFCACGCGEETMYDPSRRSANAWVRGHDKRR